MRLYHHIEISPGHDLEQHEAKAATCTEVGWDAYVTCKREGCTHTTYKEIPAPGHDPVYHNAKAANCTEIGWNAYDTCKREGCTHTTYKEIPALNHDLEQHEAKAATCTEIGWNEYDTCTRCDYTTYVELPALKHDYQQSIVKPTCGKDGYTRYTCSRCDETRDLYFRTISFVVPDGVAAIESIATKDSETVALPTPTGTPLANAKAYTFAGWVIGTVADTVAAPVFYEAGSEYTVGLYRAVLLHRRRIHRRHR